MAHETSAIAAVTVALAMAAGMVSQSLARHLRLPGIVLLLAAGVLLGPDLAGAVIPGSLGSALQILVGFAVAVILFEGGMNLNLKRLRAQARVIRRLLTVGALVTAAGAFLSVLLIMRWDWEISVLFGTLVIVTGPTVITPLLRRIKVQHKIETVLEAEGVLIDAIGAVVAVVAIEVVLDVSRPGQLFAIVERLGFGALCGVAAGFLLAGLLRFDKVVPQGLENVFTLSFVLAVFQVSNFLFEESGIVAVTAAGMVIGNVKTRVGRELMEFKEQLTVLLIGMLFVLLAADVRIDDVRSLGWRGVAAVLALMLLVRPLNVLVSTWGSELTIRERLFLSWLAPRGIVAAAVASLFAQRLTREDLAGAEQLRPLVFMVIAVTVLVQGLSGGFVARILGLRRVTNRGYAILGANELGHAIGRLLRDSGEEVLFLDSNPGACNIVEQDGFKVVFGNVLEERTLQRAQLDDRAVCIGVTPNEEANLLFAHRAIDEFRVPRVLVAVGKRGTTVKPEIVRKAGARLLFGAPRDLDLWALRLRRKTAPIEIWRYAGVPKSESGEVPDPLDPSDNRVLPLVVWRGELVFAANGLDGIHPGDVVHLALFSERLAEVHAWLAENGWVPTDVAAEGVADAGERVVPGAGA